MITNLTSENYSDTVTNSTLPVVVDVYANWCGPCKALGPIIEELSSELEGRVQFAKVDVDQQQELTAELAITALPTLIFFQGGEEKLRQIGLIDKTDMQSKIAKAFDGALKS
ncbi:MAG: Thioredoxin [Chlamydiae bacterium]|nr:Thioredoxin [Chlamydiota bacterium]